MEVIEKKSDGLSREYGVVLAAAEVEEKMHFKLQQIAETVRLPGFRPGKVPPKILRQRYGSRVMGEVLEEAVNDSSQQILKEKGLRPVSQPDIQVTSFDEGKDLEYTLAIEVFPEITPIDFTKLALERFELIPDSKKVNDALENIALANKTTRPIKTKRKSKTGDIVILDFIGKVDNTEFPGGSAENYNLELGSNTFIPGFEEQIIGTQAGDELDVTVKFPEDYQAEQLAGKSAVFECKIHELHEAEKALIDDDLAKKVGMSDLNALKKAIEEEQNREFEQMSRLIVKRQLLDALESKHNFDLPQKMIENEHANILSQVKKDEKDPSKHEEATDDKEYFEIARRRVKLGLLLSEIGRINGIELNQDDMKKAMLEETKKHPGEEQKVMDYFKNNPKAIEQLTAPIYEDKVIDFVLEQSSVTAKKTTMDGMIKALEDENKEKHKKNLVAAKKPGKKQKKGKSSTTKKTTKQKKSDPQ